MVCGGLGLVIAAALFFGWRRSEAKWKRIVAWIAGVWGGISIAFYLGIGGLYLLGEYSGPRWHEPTSTPIQSQAQAPTVPASTPQAQDTPNSKPRATDTPRPTRTLRPTRTPMPTETPAPVPGDIVLEDSFSGPGSEARWLLAKDDDFSAVIENGKLVLSAANADGLAWAYSIEAYSGMDLEVEATILRGKRQAMFGVSFGLEPAGDKGAVCLVRGDGFAVCGELVGDEPEGRGLIRVEVAPEGNSNPIRLVTVRDQWALHVNGQCVSSGQREAAQRGQVALLAGTDSDSASSQIAYDDLVIRVPDKDSEDLVACEPAPYSTEPSPGAGERRETAQPPEPEGNGTIHLSSETTAVATCRLSVWGGSVEDLLLDAGPGHPASRVLPAGQYSWQMHFGPRGRTDAATMQLAPGGSCSFTCYDDGVEWGCSR